MGGGDLASITSDDEHGFIVTGLLNNFKVSDNHTIIWIGGINTMYVNGQYVAGDWSWVSEEQWVEERNKPWREGEPKDPAWGDLTLGIAMIWDPFKTDALWKWISLDVNQASDVTGFICENAKTSL